MFHNHDENAPVNQNDKNAHLLHAIVSGAPASLGFIPDEVIIAMPCLIDIAGKIRGTDLPLAEAINRQLPDDGAHGPEVIAATNKLMPLPAAHIHLTDQFGRLVDSRDIKAQLTELILALNPLTRDTDHSDANFNAAVRVNLTLVTVSGLKTRRDTARELVDNTFSHTSQLGLDNVLCAGNLSVDTFGPDGTITGSVSLTDTQNATEQPAVISTDLTGMSPLPIDDTPEGMLLAATGRKLYRTHDEWARSDD